MYPMSQFQVRMQANQKGSFRWGEEGRLWILGQIRDGIFVCYKVLREARPTENSIEFTN